jgi:hypothetical protein
LARFKAPIFDNHEAVEKSALEHCLPVFQALRTPGFLGGTEDCGRGSKCIVEAPGQWTKRKRSRTSARCSGPPNLACQSFKAFRKMCVVLQHHLGKGALRAPRCIPQLFGDPWHRPGSAPAQRVAVPSPPEGASALPQDPIAISLKPGRIPLSPGPLAQEA